MSKMADILAKRLAAFDNKEARVGWFESAQYPDGMQVAEVAIIQENGAPGAGIPPRPFIAPTVAGKGEDWKENIRKGAVAVMHGKINADQVLDVVGLQAAGDIRQTISEVREPELAPSTLAQRARDGYADQPLNRTGLMIATCTSVVAERSND